jgi:hypothetical protein
MTAMSATNYVIRNGTVLSTPEFTVDVSGTFTFDETTSTESNVDLWLAPRQENSPVLTGTYSQIGPLKTSSPNSITASRATGNPGEPPVTVAVWWVIAQGQRDLTFSRFIYNNTVTGKRLEGACGGGAVPA